MYIPFRLMATRLKQFNCWKQYLQYQKILLKYDNNSLRIDFLENCKRADIIPRFLKFRIPTNGCFDEKTTHNFQQKLLNKELIKAKEERDKIKFQLEEKREDLKNTVPRKYLPSIIFHSRYDRRIAHREQSAKHNKKLTNLSEEQERPLFQVLNTVRLCDIDLKPPKYVFDTLSLGPKHAVLDKIDSKDILAELDGLLHHCVRNNVSEEIITDINVKTLNYIKKCKKMKTSRNIVMTKKYLKENNLLAVPFDKGIGIALMGRDTYYNKMNKIINLPQFEKMEKNRKNGKHPVMKEEERVVTILKNLRNEGKINEEIYEEIRPKGSQPARLYGLAKVHKKDTPVRPVLSMPGSTYHKVALKVAEWLSKVPECNINTSTKEISKKIKTITVKSDEKIVSFDVSSLYTNVPVMEAIEVCTNLLFNSLNEKPPVDREIFKILTKIASSQLTIFRCSNVATTLHVRCFNVRLLRCIHVNL